MKRSGRSKRCPGTREVWRAGVAGLVLVLVSLWGWSVAGDSVGRARWNETRFGFIGLFAPGPGDKDPWVERETQYFVPLGVPLPDATSWRSSDLFSLGFGGALLQPSPLARNRSEEQATAAFKVRLTLPGVIGEELTAKVQSLRSLPLDGFLGKEDLGPVVSMPGGPGWPEHEVVVRLRRVATSEDRTSPTFHLYESVESLLLLADPRASRDYRVQELPDGTAGADLADEASQCRRCDWPSFFPDPRDPTEASDPVLGNIRELLAAGPFLRVFLFPSPESSAEVRVRTQSVLSFFETQGENYPLPSSHARVAGHADSVPSPLQVSLAEPARNPSMWTLGEAGAQVCLTGGEGVLTHLDHTVSGFRGVPFTFERTYRSGTLGYGPLGSAGWGPSEEGVARDRSSGSGSLREPA